MAAEKRSWEGIRPVSAYWMDEFCSRETLLSLQRDLREGLEMRERRRAEEAERCSPQGRWNAARRRARTAWRAFIGSLDSLDMRRRAYTFRRLMRRLDRAGVLNEDHRPGMIRELERLGQYFGDDFPSDVLEFDCSKTLEKRRQKKAEIYAKAISVLGVIANSGDTRHAKQAKRQLDTEAKKLGLPAVTRTPGRLADMTLKRFRQPVYGEKPREGQDDRNWCTEPVGATMSQ